jgi:hypothetical protein
MSNLKDIPDGVKSKIRCDGKKIEWKPVMEPDFCNECGHQTGEHDTAEPDFHGWTEKEEGRYYCCLCLKEFVGLAVVNEVCKDKIIPWLVEEVFRENTLINFLKSRSK